MRQADGGYHRFFKVVTIAKAAGPVRSSEGPATIADYGFDDAPDCDLLLIPGGMGTRKLVDDEGFIAFLPPQAGGRP